jgi:predicted dehydrogenase
VTVTDPRLAPSAVPPPASAPPLRWGIVGPGFIADLFATALAHDTRQTVAAVGSRRLQRAADFCARHGGRAHARYEEVIEDPDVDVVYVATPHSEHREHALLAIGAGKPVLVEKAFTRNAVEAEEVLTAARDRGVFVMEAMWSRFLPRYDVIRRTVTAGTLGEVRTVLADHGQALHPGGPQRLSDPALAGGALLDLGVYPVSFASMVLGDMALNATGTTTGLGVDEQVTISAVTPDGAHAALSTTMSAATPTTASVSGRTARIELDGPFYTPGDVRLVGSDGTVLDTAEGDPSERHLGLRYEACEVARCVTEGLTESPLMPHEESLRVMRLLDEARRQVGVVYPGE